MRKSNGITLIALVITIIVLLILAGVSISAITGENGLIAKAKDAKFKTELANLKEEVGVKIIDYKLYEGSDIKNYLEEIPDSTLETIKDDTFYVTRGSATVTVYANGDVVEGEAVWDLTSKCPEIKDSNWYIYTASQLKFVADFVNNGRVLTEEQESQVKDAGYDIKDITMTKSTVVYLMNDIDLGAREIDGEWENEENEKVEWTAIGKGDSNNTDKRFIATFEGNGKSVRGVYINTDTLYNGIFGNSNSIKDLTIKNSYIKGGTCTGGIVGAFRSGTLKNCHNIDTTVILNDSECYIVGGVIGQSEGTVINCSNTGNVIAYGMSSTGNSQCGGVIGAVYDAPASNCYNSGKIESNGSHTGGVIGSVSQGITISDCYNMGNVNSNARLTGGVVGSLGNNSIIKGCYNKGTVYGNGNYVGGVLGNGSSGSTVTNCYNSGNVTGNDSKVAGVVGSVDPGSTVSKCYNTGTIAGQVEHIGGVVGLMSHNNNISNSKVEMCYNSGTVTGNICTGGVVGLVGGSDGQGTVVQCYGKGKVTGTLRIGTVVGKQTNESGLNILNNLYCLNTVGGIGVVDGWTDESNDIIIVEEDFTSLKQFLDWLENQ